MSKSDQQIVNSFDSYEEEDDKKSKKKARGVKRISHPTKTRMNFAEMGVEKINWKAAVPIIVGVLVILGILVKFFVIDRFTEYYRLQGQVNELQTRVDTDNALIASYADMLTEYAHYTYSDMKPEEMSVQNRVDVINLIKKYVLPNAQVGSWTISGNVVNLPITGVTFQEIGEIVANLEKDDMVIYCEVVAAATENSSKTYRSAVDDATDNVVLTGNQQATGQVTIYLEDVIPEEPGLEPVIQDTVQEESEVE